MIIRVSGSFKNFEEKNQQDAENETNDKNNENDDDDFEKKLKQGLLATARKTNAIILTDGYLPFIDENFEDMPVLGFANYKKSHSKDFQEKLKKHLDDERYARVEQAIKQFPSLDPYSTSGAESLISKIEKDNRISSDYKPYRYDHTRNKDDGKKALGPYHNFLAFIDSGNIEENESKMEEVLTSVESKLREKKSEVIYNEKPPGVLVCYGGDASTMVFTLHMLWGIFNEREKNYGIEQVC